MQQLPMKKMIRVFGKRINSAGCACAHTFSLHLQADNLIGFPLKNQAKGILGEHSLEKGRNDTAGAILTNNVQATLREATRCATYAPNEKPNNQQAASGCISLNPIQNG